MLIKHQLTELNKIHFINISPVFAAVLLFFCAMQPFAIQAQIKSSKWKNAEDSLVIVRSHTSQWHLYGGLHISSDAELYYAGPSFQVGVDFNFKRRLALSTYFHYFHVIAKESDNRGSYEAGRFRTFTSALLLQVDAGAGWYKGFFAGAGIALQQYADRFNGGFGSYDIQRTTVTPAIRVGYFFHSQLTFS